MSRFRLLISLTLGILTAAVIVAAVLGAFRLLPVPPVVGVAAPVFFISAIAVAKKMRMPATNPAPAETENRRGCYKSRRRGLRFGRVIRTDRSGRIRLNMGGFTVRRQPHLVRFLTA